MKVSVVMTTYNGEKYIDEQLQSIFSQTRAADEVIISDDCSSDASVDVIKKFIQKHGLDNKWHLHVNKSNLGLYTNSRNAVLMTTGDVLFWADQDDVWLPQKIEKMAGCMEQDSSIQAISCKYRMVDSKLHDINPIIHRIKKDTGRVQRKDLQYIFTGRNSAAQSLAITKKLYMEMVQKFSSPKYLFDYGVITYATAINRYYCIDSTYTLYRQHGENLSAKIISPLQLLNNSYHRLSAIENQIEMLETKYDILKTVMCDNDLAQVKEALDLNKKRCVFFKKHDIVALIKLWMHSNIYLNKKWILADIIALCKLGSSIQ